MRLKLCFTVALMATLHTSCKDKQSVSDPRDFAYSASAKNFAIMAGHAASNDVVVADIANWENLINKEQLGKFTPVYVEKTNATVAKLKAAFKLVGSQMTEDSTIVFAYSGPGKAGKLVADQEFSYEELAAALQEGLKSNSKVKKAKRFYMFIEANVDAGSATTADDQLEKTFTHFNAAENKQSLFQEKLIFGSTYVEAAPSAATTAVSNSGRFSFEFVKSLDLSIQKIRAGGERPTLRTFFDNIVSETGKTSSRKSTYRLKPDELQKELLFPATFVPPLEPTVPAVAATPTPVTANPATVPVTTPVQPLQPAASVVAETLSLPMQTATGPTNLKDHFKGSTMLLEISASWCGPCQSLAQTIAGKMAASASITSGKCSSAALIVSDNSSTLDNWGTATSPAIAAHSYQVGSGAEMTQWLSRLGGTPASVQFFPTLVLVNSAGQIQSVGADQALAAFSAACP